MSIFERKSIRPHSLSPMLLLGIALLLSLKVLVAEPAVPQAESAVPKAQQIAPQDESAISQIPESDRFDSLEAPRDYLSEKITSYANYIDRFFGGDRYYQESNKSVVKLDLTRADGYGGDSKVDLAVRLNLRLPVTEGRLHFLVESDPEKNIAEEPPKGQPVLSNKVVVPKSIALAARYATAEENVWHFSTDGGLKFPIPVTPFVRTRGSYATPMGEWRLKLAESVYWFNTLGVGETTQFDMERIISTPVLFRSSRADSTCKCNSTYRNGRQAAVASMPFLPPRMRSTDESLHAAYPRATISNLRINESRT